MKRLRPVDVVIAGAGWSGLLMAKELVTRTSLEVVVLERGPARKLADYSSGMDEVDYALRNKMMQNPAEQTITHRFSTGDKAAPIRQYGSFKPGTGTGGTGEHWGGVSDRYEADFFTLETHLRQVYGASRLPPDVTIQDWGLTYDDLENDYWRAEQLLGVSGKAGNLRGKLVEGGNIFEAPRRHEYPTPPLTPTYSMTHFRKGAESLGYHPYPMPASNLSRNYTNPDGVSRPGCVYCGYCPSFGCMIGAKAQPTNVLMPVLHRTRNFVLRNQCWVRRVVHRDGVAEGVVYMDEAGEETLQPAKIVVLAAWTPHNVRLLLLSAIGDAYDPASGKGTLGKNLTHQVGSGGGMIVHDKPLNSFMTSGATGFVFADLNGDRGADPSFGTLQGGMFGRGNSPVALPITSFGTIPPDAAARNWGSEWKKAGIRYYDRIGGGGGFTGGHFAYRQNYMDLDPTYTDKWGDPLLRLTLDWTEYEHRQMAWGAKVSAKLNAEIARVAGAKFIARSAHDSINLASKNGKQAGPQYNAARYQTTHIQGGAMMGVSADRSVVNPWLQHWKVPNLWVIGSSSFPQSASGNPTLTILAVTYRAADAIIDRYLDRSKPLA
jgi:gluconate 2-dehydrogenase alpha chain